MSTNGSSKLTPRQSKFVKNLAKGVNKRESAMLAGYKQENAHVQASRLLKNVKIIDALDKAGLTDSVVAKGIRTNIEAGLGVKATASDSLKGLELVTKLKGYQQPANTQPTTQTNILIKEMNNMSDKDINAKLKKIQEDIEALQ